MPRPDRNPSCGTGRFLQLRAVWDYNLVLALAAVCPGSAIGAFGRRMIQRIVGFDEGDPSRHVHCEQRPSAR